MAGTNHRKGTRSVFQIFPAAKPRPEAIVEHVEYLDDPDEFRSGSRQRLAQVAVMAVGSDGLNRIRERAIKRLWGRKIGAAFQCAYERFQETYQPPPVGTPGRYRDALEAFGAMVGLSRSTIDKYRNGHITDTPVPDLDKYIRRAGIDWSQILPTDEELLHAVMSDTIAAMMTARGIPACGVRIADGDLAQITRFQLLYPIPAGGFKSDGEWWDYLLATYEAIAAMVLREEASEHASKSLVATIRTLLVECGDWQAASRYFVLQIVVALATLLRLMEADASAGMRRNSGKRRAFRERALADKLAKKLQDRVDFLWKHDKRSPAIEYFMEPTIQLADLLVMSGRYLDALQPLWLVASAYRHSADGQDVPRRPELRPMIERILNEILSVHGADTVDSLRPHNLVSDHEKEFASLLLRMIMESMGMLAGQIRIEQV